MIFIAADHHPEDVTKNHRLDAKPKNVEFMKTFSNYQKYVLLVLTVLSVAAYALPSPGKYDVPVASSSQQILQRDQYIDANNVLMFVTNKGSFAYDQGGLLGKNDGFYYPYYGTENIQNGTVNRTVCFAAGLWLAGVNSSTGDTLVSVSDYSDVYWPGPMSGGTFIPDADTDSLYRVYKIFSDSMSSNPNQDYLEWPVSQGAPVDSSGIPLLRGKQTLWTVFNDANSAVHNNDASSAIGLGIEVQHTVWANTGGSGSYILPGPTHFVVSQIGLSDANVTVEIIDETQLTGHDYEVSTSNDSTLGPVWHLIDVTLNDTVLANQTNFGKLHTTVTDGFLIQVLGFATAFESIEVVANSSGPLDPPAGGALDFQGFPSIRPDNTQQVGAGIWALHTGDNGGSCNGGNRGSYDSFLSRVLRGDNAQDLANYDYEMRFTGDTNSSGAYDSSLGGGSIAIRAFQDESPTWVPFELWNTGKDTPDDASDDVRMVVWQIDLGDDYSYNLESWGCALDSLFGPAGGEHSASGADDDPFTDWIYWLYPIDSTPGDAGYQTRAAEILAGTYDFGDEETIARTVLINWNGGVTPPFNQSLPEPGTVFRLRTPKILTPDTFAFTAAVPPTVTAGAEDLSVYSKYKLINKSGNTYNGFFISLWFDPDLGNAGDDFVGCDTLNDIFFCYNDGTDSEYGIRVPAFGGKLIEGPITPSIGDIAYVDGQPVIDYKNLGMYSFFKWINVDDPISPRWTYQYMNGLAAWGGGVPLSNGTRYTMPGDPVTGTGELDNTSSDRRMFVSFGPFDFAPNDTQQIIIKLGVGQGDDAISSVTKLREVLNFDPCCIGIRGDIDGDSDDSSVIDLNYLVDFMFRGGPAPPCPVEADLNFDGRSASILDLTFIIDDLYRGGPSPGNCY